MARTWITAQEGKIVYINHRISETVSGERGVRGIIYRGDCYDIKMLSDNQNDPTIHLERIDENLVLDLKVIPEQEQGLLEKKITEYCKVHSDGTEKEGKMKVSMEIPICLSRYQL